jgi:hypothetical protein
METDFFPWEEMPNIYNILVVKNRQDTNWKSHGEQRISPEWRSVDASSCYQISFLMGNEKSL